MPFIQIIEYRTNRADEIDQLAAEWAQATEGKRTATRSTQCVDRDNPGTRVLIAEFPSYEEAMRNSELPETRALAEKIAKLCDGPPIFRNLDVASTLV
jgi:quinol monooxygenase YgiN